MRPEGERARRDPRRRAPVVPVRSRPPSSGTPFLLTGFDRVPWAPIDRADVPRCYPNRLSRSRAPPATPSGARDWTDLMGQAVVAEDTVRARPSHLRYFPGVRKATWRRLLVVDCRESRPGELRRGVGGSTPDSTQTLHLLVLASLEGNVRSRIHPDPAPAETGPPRHTRGRTQRAAPSSLISAPDCGVPAGDRSPDTARANLAALAFVLHPRMPVGRRERSSPTRTPGVRTPPRTCPPASS